MINVYCSNVGAKAGTENCNYCIIRKSCSALKEAKRLAKIKGDKDMKFEKHTMAGNTTGKNNIETIMKILQSTSCTPSMPLHKDKIKRIYEDDDFIIDLITADTPTVRVSIFKDNHFQDEVFIRKDDYLS